MKNFWILGRKQIWKTIKRILFLFIGVMILAPIVPLIIYRMGIFYGFKIDYFSELKIYGITMLIGFTVFGLAMSLIETINCFNYMKKHKLTPNEAMLNYKSYFE